MLRLGLGHVRTVDPVSSLFTLWQRGWRVPTLGVVAEGSEFVILPSEFRDWIARQEESLRRIENWLGKALVAWQPDEMPTPQAKLSLAQDRRAVCVLCGSERSRVGAMVTGLNGAVCEVCIARASETLKEPVTRTGERRR
jgi:hypothetical protein